MSLQMPASHCSPSGQAPSQVRVPPQPSSRVRHTGVVGQTFGTQTHSPDWHVQFGPPGHWP